MKIAGLISENIMEKPVNVSYTWYDKSKGLISWNFENPNNKELSFILIRGIKEDNKVSNIYAFGDAFYPIYYYDFKVKFEAKPEILKNISIENNSAPLGIIENNNNTFFVAFVYTLGPMEKYSMLEGGWINIEPGGIETIMCDFKGVNEFSIDYDKNQCTLYNQEADTDYQCPPDPFNVKSGIFKINKNVKPLFNDKIDIVKNECNKMLKEAMENNNYELFYESLLCLLDNYKN